MLGADPLFQSMLDEALSQVKIKELEEELKNFEEVRKQLGALESQLLQKDQKFGALIEEKEGELARLSKEREEASHQLQQVAEEKDGKIKKLETQLRNALDQSAFNLPSKLPPPPHLISISLSHLNGTLFSFSAETLQQDLVNLDSEAQAVSSPSKK
jgi:DNA repair exonuclease SbcCD ATPase subunit